MEHPDMTVIKEARKQDRPYKIIFISILVILILAIIITAAVIFFIPLFQNDENSLQTDNTTILLTVLSNISALPPSSSSSSSSSHHLPRSLSRWPTSSVSGSVGSSNHNLSFFLSSSNSSLYLSAAAASSAFSSSSQNKGANDAIYSELAASTSTKVEEGDIIPETFGELLHDTHRSLTTSRDERSALLWPNAIIPYKFSEYAHFTREERKQIIRVMKDFAQSSCVKWIPQTTETSFVLVTKNHYLGCASHVGFKVGMRVLSLDNGCFTYGTIYHEMLHSIGFYHEQSRLDRDDFIEVHWENIDNGIEQNFRKRSFDVDLANSHSPYDYNSVMHYSSTAFSKNGKPTIIPKKKHVRIGQREKPSDIDLWEINKLYNCPNTSQSAGAGGAGRAKLVTLPSWAFTTTMLPPAVTLPYYCSFDNGICGFRQPWRSFTDDMDWSRHHGSTGTPFTGPNNDHTQGNINGYYLYVEASKSRPSSRAVLISPVLTAPNRKFCLSFYYHMYGKSIGTFTVFHTDQQDIQRSKLWSRLGQVSQSWEHGVANFTSADQPFRIVFEAEIPYYGAGVEGDIALDDVFVTACETPETRLPFTCSFESGWCGLIQDWRDDFNWERDKGALRYTTTSSSSSVSNASTAASTGGDGSSTSKSRHLQLASDLPDNFGYYAVSHSQLHDVKDTAVLLTPRFNPRGYFCLSFYYHVFGPLHSARLRLFLQRENQRKDYFGEYFKATSTNRNKWTFVFSTHRSTVPLQVGFESTILLRDHDLAIDDLSISLGDCGNSDKQTINYQTDGPTQRYSTATTLHPAFRPSNLPHHPAPTGTPPPPPRRQVQVNGYFPEVTGYQRYDGNCPRNVLRRCTRNICPSIQECATLCSQNYLCEGVSYIFDRTRESPCLLKRQACDNSDIKFSHNVRFYRKQPLTDYCKGHMCHNGATCESLSYTYQCLCPPGFRGSYCEIADPCFSQNPCRHGSTCLTSDATMEPVCLCAKGYRGIYCAIDIDECSPNPCMRGTCQDLVNSYQCHCFPGYAGNNCEIDVDECASKPCLNNGQCLNKINAYDCICPTGFSGKQCESRVTGPLTAIPFRCDFDKSAGFCGMIQDYDDQFDWTRNRGPTLSFETGPKLDHTSGKGYYIYMESSFPIKYNDKARLLTPLLDLQGGVSCLSFFYHMHGSNFDMGTLNIYTQDELDNRRLVWTKTGAHGDAWIPVSIDLTGDYPVKIMLEGVKGYGFQSDIAVDDFEVSPGTCNTDNVEKRVDTSSPSKELHLFKCTFENGFCEMKQEKVMDNFDWSRFTGRTPSTGTGPNGDHTTGSGYYAYAESSFPQKPQNTARLLSPSIQTTGDICVVFHYHMLGSGMGSLNLFKKVVASSKSGGIENLIWTKSGSQENQWRSESLDLKSDGTVQIVFEAVRGASFESDIALDDISIKSGRCNSYGSHAPSNPGGSGAQVKAPRLIFSCDFERSMCNFNQDLADNGDWLRGNQYNLHNTPDYGTQPVNSKGSYIYIAASVVQLPGAVYRLTSAKLSTSSSGSHGSNGASPTCIHFRYLINGPSDVGILRLFMVTSLGRQYIWHVSQSQGSFWQLAQVNIPASAAVATPPRGGSINNAQPSQSQSHQPRGTFPAQLQFGFESMRGSSWDTEVAIDEVELYEGTCSSSTSSPRHSSSSATNTQPISSSKKQGSSR